MIKAVLELNTPTKDTGLIYSRSEISKAVEYTLLNLNKMFIVLDPPDDVSKINIDKICATINDIEIDKTNLVINYNILNTPCGKIFKELETQLRISPIMTGYTHPDNRVTDISIYGFYCRSS